MPTGEPLLESSDRVLIMTPDANTHRRDFDFVFEPDSNVLAAHYAAAAECRLVRVPVAPVDARTLRVLSGQHAFAASARTVLDALTLSRWTHVIVLCHGWATGLQLGFRSSSQRAGDLQNLTALKTALHGLRLKTLTLFACSAGSDPKSARSSPGGGDASIADELRDAAGCTVIAHSTVGHATRNLDLIVFEGSDTPLIGGIHVPTRGTKLYKNAAKLLTNKKRPGARRATGDMPPRGHTRPAFASIPLCRTAAELQALLSSEPRAAGRAPGVA